MNREEFVDALKSASNEIDGERVIKIIDKIVELDNLPETPARTNMIITMEELAELSQEISKCLRNKGDKVHLLEEIADVAICLVLVMRVYNITDEELFKAINVKLNRGADRLNIKIEGDN